MAITHFSTSSNVAHGARKPARASFAHVANGEHGVAEQLLAEAALG